MFCWENNPQLDKIEKSFRISRFQNFSGGMPPEPRSKILPRLLQRSGYGPASTNKRGKLLSSVYTHDNGDEAY